MPVKFGSILHLNNSASEATLDANNLRGTTIQIDAFNSSSLATIGSGLVTAPGKRRLGTIVSTTGSVDKFPEYYVYHNTSSGDLNLSGSEWTTLNNWREIALQSNSVIFHNITASGNISASGHLNAFQLQLDNIVAIDRTSTGDFAGDDNLNLGNSTTWKHIKLGASATTTPITAFGDITASGDISASGDIIANTGSFNHISSSGTIEMLTASIGGGIFTSASLAALAGGTGVGFPFTGSAGISGSLVIRDSVSSLLLEEPSLNKKLKFSVGSNGIATFNAIETDQQIAFNTENTERLRIDSTGKLGIGTQTPSAKLDINNSNTTSTTLLQLSDMGGTDAHTHIQLSNNGTPTLTPIGQIITDDDDLKINARDDLILQQGTLDSISVGNVGIGIASPNEKLTVIGNISASGNILAGGSITASLISVNSLSVTNLTASIITASRITASRGLKVSESADFSDANLTLGGFSFTNTSIINFPTGTQFGTSSIGTAVQNTIHGFTGSINITGSGIFPDNSNIPVNIGSAGKKFNNLFAVNTFFGGIHEVNLETEGLNKMKEGTVLSLKNGILQPCEKEGDPLVMGIVSKESNFPIILGAEPVLVTGNIKEGDFIITSNLKGHGKGVNPKYIYNKKLFGKIIAQAIEKGRGKSYTIKAMIRKI
jgi:hypothetical protein